MLGSGINLIWCHFYSCLLSNWLFAEKFSNCSNSLNFEAKINCNTFKPNVPKWRKTCTELKFDLLHFNGPQSHILSGDTFEGPCTKNNFVSEFLPTYVCYVGDHLGQAVFAVLDSVVAGVPLLLLGSLPLLHRQHRHAGVFTGPILRPDWLCEDGWRGCEVKRPQHNLQK